MLSCFPVRSLKTDFCKSAISPCRLSNFTKKIDSEIINRTANVGQGSTGVYGPADDGAPIRRAQAPQTGPYREFAVKIPSTCGDDEPDVDRCVHYRRPFLRAAYSYASFSHVHFFTLSLMQGRQCLLSSSAYRSLCNPS